MENGSIELNFDRKLNAIYPKFPGNQILFTLNFGDQKILNDILELIMSNCSKKNILDLLIFKIFKTDIKKNLKKSPLLLNILENFEKIENNGEAIETFYMNNLIGGGGGLSSMCKYNSNEENSSYNNFSHQEETLLNEFKPSFNNNKIYRDSED